MMIGIVGAEKRSPVLGQRPSFLHNWARRYAGEQRGRERERESSGTRFVKGASPRPPVDQSTYLRGQE